MSTISRAAALGLGALLLLPGIAGAQETPAAPAQDAPAAVSDGPAGGTGVEGRALAHIGARPFYLVDQMEDGELKTALQQCEGQPFYASDFSIGHRGAPLQFPEHTRESYVAAARQGAGVIECDVAFTKDRELVCRHAQCDLHTTTDILTRPELASKCTQGFTPADPANGAEASAKCCTSDLTLAEFKSLNGKMDSFDANATTVEAFTGGLAPWRTTLYANSGTLLSHKESIELIRSLGRRFTPELKTPEVEMPFEGDYTQEDYASQMIAEYEEAGIPASDVYPQSFLLEDVLHWIAEHPEFGSQAVYLDDRDADESFDVTDPRTWDESMQELADRGVRIIAPPLWMLVRAGENGAMEPSIYAEEAKKAGLDIIAWSLERSGPLDEGGGYYYQTVNDIVDSDGDMLELLDVLAKDVGVLGVFSDWPATTTFYANCAGLGAAR